MKSILFSLALGLATLSSFQVQAGDGGETPNSLYGRSGSSAAVQSQSANPAIQELLSLNPQDSNDGIATLEPRATEEELGFFCQTVIGISGSDGQACIEKVQAGQFNKYAFAICQNYADKKWPRDYTLGCLDKIQDKKFAPSALRAGLTMQAFVIANWEGYTMTGALGYLQYSADHDYDAPVSNLCLEFASNNRINALNACLYFAADRAFENVALLTSCRNAADEQMKECLLAVRSKPSQRLAKQLADQQAQEALLKKQEEAKQRAALVRQRQEEAQAAIAQKENEKQREINRCAKARVIVGQGKIGTDGRMCN